MSDQCALDESGNLREAKDIEFFFSESETAPLPSSAPLPQRNPGNFGLRRSHRKRNVDKLYTSIAAEQCNEYGATIKKHRPKQQGQRSSRSAKKPRVDTAGMDESDPEDSDFMSDGSSVGSSEDGETEVDDAQHQQNPKKT
ncbi:hypothetical protein BC826DRAFT_1109379 [Russula brevipes]|nr:hypothetical protein BC826DRAFT_1109379 [Russula brevipes]